MEPLIVLRTAGRTVHCVVRKRSTTAMDSRIQGSGKGREGGEERRGEGMERNGKGRKGEKGEKEEGGE